jgi:autotransporter-associated beta strand protein
MKKVSVGLAACFFASQMLAVERVWNGADGANWTDASVWTTNGAVATAPESTDTVTIANGTTVNLTSPALTGSNYFALVQLTGNTRGTLRVGPGGYLPTAQLSVSQSGTGPNTPGHVIVDGGSVCATNLQLFGSDNVNSPASLDIINNGNYTSTAAFRVYNGSVLVSNSTFNATFTTYLHGSTATSLFEIVDSTVNLTAMAIGRDVNNAGGKVCRNILRMRSGNLNLSGTLEVGHTGNGTAGITGVVEQASGAVTIGGAGMLSMPVNVFATGFYNLNGGLLSLLNGADSMRIGGRDAAGKGYFTMTDGVFTNKGTAYLGTAIGGYGKFEQSGGVSYFQKPFQIGATTNAVGDFNLLGGTFNLPVSGANINLGNYSNAIGRCYVGGGLLNAAGRSIYLGAVSYGTGTFVQAGGIVSNASTVVGSAYLSSGSLIVSNGLFITASGLNLGNASNAIGRCEIDGGLLSVNGGITLGCASNSVGEFVMNGGIVSNNGFVAGNILSTTGIVTITGGQMFAAGEFLIAFGANAPTAKGAIATFTMSGGKLQTTYRFILGAYGSGFGKISGGEIEALRNPATGGTDQCIEVGRDPGTFGRLEMTGGVLKGTNELVLARDAGSTGLVYVAGGDIYVNAIRRSLGVSELNLAGGTLHPYNRSISFGFNANLTNDIGYGDSGTVFGVNPVDKDGTERAMAVQGTFTGNGGLAKRGTGTVTLGGNLTYTGRTVVESGTLALSNGVTQLASSLILIQTNAVLDVSLNRSVPFVIANGQTLSGAGSVTGAVRLVSGAVIGGGTAASPGELTIQGNLTLDAGSTLLFNMAGGVYGRVHVTGDLTLPASANLIVNGAAVSDAQGRVMLTWDGALNMPSATAWSVTGEKTPWAVISASAKTLTLSYVKGTVILVN